MYNLTSTTHRISRPKTNSFKLVISEGYSIIKHISSGYSVVTMTTCIIADLQFIHMCSVMELADVLPL